MDTAIAATSTGYGYTDIAIIAIFLISIIWGAFRGARRGASRQILHSFFAIGAAVTAFFLCVWASSQLFTEIGSMTTGDILTLLEQNGLLTGLSEGIRGTVTSFDSATLSALLAIPVATVIIPIIFALLFILLNILFKIIYLLVSLVAGLSRRGGFFKRTLGFLVGAAEGVAVAAIILLPVFGISATVADATEAVRGEESASGFVELSDASFVAIAKSPIAGLVEKAGGEMIMEKLSTVKLGDEEIDMRAALGDAVKLYAIGAPLVEANWTALNDTDKATINKLIDTLDASPYVEELIAGILRGTATAVDSGYIPIEAEPPYDKLTGELLRIFKGSTADNVTTDIRTVVKVLYILSDDGVLAAVQSDGSGLTDALTAIDGNGDTTVKRLIAAMRENDRTAGLVSTLTELSLAMLSESLGLSDDATEIYTNVKEGIGDVLAINRNDFETPDEYIEAVSNELDSKLQENDIVLDKAIIDEMAKNIHDKELDLGDITEETLDEVILSYYDAYLAGQIELPIN